MADRVGREGLGFKVAMMALDGARISIGSIASGLSQHAMEIAKAYANERTTFGKPIKAYQGISFKFARYGGKGPCYGSDGLGYCRNEGEWPASLGRGGDAQAHELQMVQGDLR